MLIKVKVILGVNKDKIIPKTKDSFEVYTKAKPIQGMANLAIISLLSQYFQIPEKNIKIIKGFKTRNKIFKIK
ncbi:hypothetical protein B6D52_01070 [Candidatus Parcubacteria bacterium 4484_255]|nr:MAG: hypothetical protein B6D52_01070 [Candidatus Parcubacteria bacterium 4484_255]